MSTRHQVGNSGALTRHTLKACPLHALIACLLVTPSGAELPSSLPDSGALLSAVSLIPGVEMGVYGPRFVSANEPALLAVLISGDLHSTIERGFIIIAAPNENVDFTQAPPPSGAYLTSAESAGDNTQWLPLLNAATTTLWTLRVLPMAHSRSRLSAGAILDATVLSPHLSQPERGSVFRTVSDRSRSDYDSLCLAFVTHPGVGDKAPEAAETPTNPEISAGVRGIRISLPLEFRHPTALVSFWLALTVNGQATAKGLSVPIGRDRPQVTAERPLSDIPSVTSPTPDAIIGKTVDVVGRTRPGTLAVAWLQWPGVDPLPPENDAFVARRITDEQGRFSLHLPTPPLRTPTATAIELHVRTEAPGYQSQPLIVPLRINTAQ